VRIEMRAVYLAMTAVLGFGWGLIIPAYAVYYVRTAGLSPLELVLVGTATEASYFLFNIPTGAFADSYGRRWAIVLGVAIGGAGWLIQGLVPTVAVILLGASVSGIGEAFTNGATEAWIADEVGDAALPALFSRASQVRRVTYLAGLGGSVALASVSSAAPLIASGAVYGLVAVALVFVLREPAFRRPTGRQSWRGLGATSRESAILVRRRPFLLTLFAATAFVGAASEGYDRLSDPHILSLLPAALAPVTAFALIDVAATLLGIGMAEIARRTARVAVPVLGRVLAAAEALRIVAILVFALASGLPFVLCAAFGKMAIQSVTEPLYHAWLTANIEPRVRATVLSMHSLCNAGGQIAGGPVIGAIGSLSSVRAALAASAVFLLPNVLLYLRAGGHARAAILPAEATP
jgi:DHA3 family tetracycline resistance protein-like MFS transporter